MTQVFASSHGITMLHVISRRQYVTDKQFAQMTEERRLQLGDRSLSAAEVWFRNLPGRSRERERQQRLTRYLPVPDEPRDNADVSSRPRLKLLERALHDAGIQTTKSYVKQMRRAAKQLNACSIIGRKCYVNDEQLAQLLEAYRWQLGTGHTGVHGSWLRNVLHAPQLRGVRHTEMAYERAKRRLEQMEREARERRRKERERDKR
jgi:hypothetical protein